MKAADKISFASTGSGAFLKTLQKDGLLNVIKNAKVEILQILGIRDLNPAIGDFKSLGYYINQRTHVDVLFRGYRNLGPKIPDYPSILQTLDGRADLYYPDEAIKASNFNNGLIPQFYTTDCNIYVTLDHL